MALAMKTLALSLIALYFVFVGMEIYAYSSTNGVAVQLHPYGPVKYSVHYGWDQTRTSVYSSFHKDHVPHWGYAP